MNARTFDPIKHAWESVNRDHAMPDMPAGLSPIHYSSTIPRIGKAHLVGRVKRAARKAGRA